MHERAAGKLREALELWRGPALADLAYEPFAQAEIPRLEELRPSALEARIDVELAAAATPGSSPSSRPSWPSTRSASGRGPADAGAAPLVACAPRRSRPTAARGACCRKSWGSSCLRPALGSSPSSSDSTRRAPR